MFKIKRIFIILTILIMLPLFGCDSVQNEYSFEDEFVAYVFDKEASDITEADYKELLTKEYIEIPDDYSDIIYELPEIAPSVRFLEITNFDIFTNEQVRVLDEFNDLCAIAILASGFEDLNFIQKYSYVQLKVPAEDDYKFLKDQFEYASQVDGEVYSYMRVVNRDEVIEYFDTDTITKDGNYASKMFITKFKGENSELVQTFESQRAGNVVGSIFLEDVNFDGKNDLIVPKGRYGSKFVTFYDCYLYTQNGYVQCEDFSKFANLKINIIDEKILSDYGSNEEVNYKVLEFKGDELIFVDELGVFYTEKETIDKWEDKWLIDTYFWEDFSIIDEYASLKFDSVTNSSISSYVQLERDEFEQSDLDELKKSKSFDGGYALYKFDTLKYLPEILTNVSELSIYFNGCFTEEEAKYLKDFPKLEKVQIIADEFEYISFVEDYKETTLIINQDIKNKNDFDLYGVVKKDGFVYRYKLLRSGGAEEKYLGEIKIYEIEKDKEKLIQSIDVETKYIENIIVYDVNFDGHDDILYKSGFGDNTYAVHYKCYLYNKGIYEVCEEFENIYSPGIDSANERIYSLNRESDEHWLYMFYKFIDDELVITDTLDRIFLYDETDEAGNYQVDYEECKNINTNVEVKHYSSKDYETIKEAQSEMQKLFYEGGFWDLYAYIGRKNVEPNKHLIIAR